MATLATQAKMEAQAQLAPLVPQDPLDPLARMERRDPLVPPLLALPPLLESKDPLARMAHQDQLARTVPQVPMEVQAPLDQRDHPALLDPLAMMEPQETKDPLAPMDPRENLVSAPSTAPPMVVSSSRMEQDDKPSSRPATSLSTSFNWSTTLLQWSLIFDHFLYSQNLHLLGFLVRRKKWV
jgi:hypothetical protein